MAFRPLVISHAGCGGHAPPDTLAGVRKAIELGADAIEVDVQVSAEGVPVVIHDDTVDSTTDGTGNIHLIPLAEISKLNAAAHYPAWPEREIVPTLEQVVQEVRGRALLVLDVKRSDIEGVLLDVLRMNGAIGQVMVWSTRPHVVAQFREYQPSMPAALGTGGEEWPDLELFFQEALSRGAQLCTVHHSVLTRELVHRARLLGLGPYAWTVNEEADMRRMLDCGVAGIITDYPDRLINLLDELAL